MRKQYQDLYTKLSPFQKVQTSDNHSTSASKSKSFSEMNGKQKAAMIGSTVLSLAGVIGGAIAGTGIGNVGVTGGAMMGGQIAGQFNGFINALAPNEQITESKSQSFSTTTENKTVTDMLSLLDELL